jgi:hypothetical protein
MLVGGGSEMHLCWQSAHFRRQCVSGMVGDCRPCVDDGGVMVAGPVGTPLFRALTAPATQNGPREGASGDR